LKNNNNKLLVFYNLRKKIKIALKNDNFYFDKETNCVHISYSNPSLLQRKASNIFKKISYSFENYFSKKIKFKGKGFRLKIKKKHKAIKFLFGHSHLNILFLKNVKLKKCGKYKLTIKSTLFNKSNVISKQICLIKPVNVYTNRGIRVSRQIIFKRKGKKGSYI
jgi:ribosomal protein L6P/L9E